MFLWKSLYYNKPMKSKTLSKIPLALSGYALGVGGLGGAIINFISEFNNSSNS